MSGKFASKRDEVVYRATLDGTCDTMGSVDENGRHYSKLLDFYGYDYIVTEDDQGFVTVEQFDHIDIDTAIGGGYFVPVERAWATCATDVNSWHDEDEDPEEWS